jgi:hypothetical protein
MGFDTVIPNNRCMTLNEGSISRAGASRNCGSGIPGSGRKGNGFVTQYSMPSRNVLRIHCQNTPGPGWLMVREARLATALTPALSQREREKRSVRIENFEVSAAVAACSTFERGSVRILTTRRSPKRGERPSLSLRERAGVRAGPKSVLPIHGLSPKRGKLRARSFPRLPVPGIAKRAEIGFILAWSPQFPARLRA